MSSTAPAQPEPRPGPRPQPRTDPVPGWRIGSVAGTPVYLGRSWPVIVLLVVLVVVPAQNATGTRLAQSLVVALAFAVMLLVSVLVHEAAHALVALGRGHRVDRIVADVWGGHTVYDATSSTPVSTALIAVAGPLSNLALALVSWLAQPHADGLVLRGVLDAVTYTNLFVGLYNLLPGLPLDGGQIVSSLVWRATGRKGAGLTAAGWLGRVVALGSVAWFLGRPLLEGTPITELSPLAIVWPAMIGFFLWRGASAAIRSGQIHDATGGPATDVLEPVVLVPAGTSLGELDRGVVAAAPAPEARPHVVATDPAGWPLGLVDGQSAAAVPAEVRGGTPVSAVLLAQPASWVLALPADAVLTDLIRDMSARELSFAVVVDSTSRRPLGLASAERINAVVGAELARRARR